MARRIQPAEPSIQLSIQLSILSTVAPNVDTKNPYRASQQGFFVAASLPRLRSSNRSFAPFSGSRSTDHGHLSQRPRIPPLLNTGYEF